MLAVGAEKKDGAGGSLEEAKGTIFDESLKCTMCMELCNRPVTVSLDSMPEALFCESCHCTCCRWLGMRNIFPTGVTLCLDKPG